jgi:hypothetical protein
MQLALQLATMTNPMLAEQIAQDVIATNGGAATPMGIGNTAPSIVQADNIGGMQKQEHSVVRNARQQSNEASQPNSEGVIGTRG